MMSVLVGFFGVLAVDFRAKCNALVIFRVPQPDAQSALHPITLAPATVLVLEGLELFPDRIGDEFATIEVAFLEAYAGGSVYAFQCLW
eukprot:CAMPEP_0201875810 /NCGR_PEP_ID=MMETSP0902-20130614/7683_1 /ASSEMBLY_ACC=CAM_ASM_000551 /TAXON_ID=420261 /ORGANISM="Thalassiosira antarctica, Strain CCMP982" /LENGTH=87 /DNA_ID=CAMNT_0048402935 /DNA_START=157 /DNA_END=417 /DNA_ORIENTATION=+